MKRKCEHLSLLVVSVALLTGCATYTPLPLVPLDEYEAIRRRGVAEYRIAAKSTHKQPRHEETVQDVLGFAIATVIDPTDGLSRSEANSLALYYSPALVEKRRELQIAEAILLEAGLPENPEISIGPRWSTEGGGLIFPASLTFQLPLLNEHGARSASAAFEVSKDKWLLLARELEVLAEVQKQSRRLVALQALEDVATLQLRRTDELLAWVESLFSSGEVDSFSLQVAQRASENARAEQMELSLKRKRLKREFLTTLGLFPDADVSIELGGISLLKVPPQRLGREEIIQHPHLKALEEEYKAAEEALKAEVRSQFPHLAVGPQYESDRGESTIGFGIGFEIPLFAQNDTAVALAEVRRNSIRMEYQATLKELLKEGANVRDELSALNERLAHLEVNAARDAKALSNTFSSTLASADKAALEALTAASSLADTLSEEITLRERRDISHINLLLVTGSLLPDGLTIDETILGERDE